MTARLLRADEWPRLAETGLDMATWMALDPSSSQIVIVEDDEGQIAACWGTFAVRHVEGFWVRETHRNKGGALRRLFTGMREVLTALGSVAVVTQAETSQIAGLLKAAGATPLKGQAFLLPVDFGPWAKG